MDKRVRILAVIIIIFFSFTVFLSPTNSIAGNLSGGNFGSGALNQFQNLMNKTTNAINQEENNAINSIPPPQNNNNGYPPSFRHLHQPRFRLQ